MINIYGPVIPKKYFHMAVIFMYPQKATIMVSIYCINYYEANCEGTKVLSDHKYTHVIQGS